MIIRFMMMPIISAALKGINWEEGNRLLYLRIVFMGVQLATLLVYGLAIIFTLLNLDCTQASFTSSFGRLGTSDRSLYRFLCLSRMLGL